MGLEPTKVLYVSRAEIEKYIGRLLVQMKTVELAFVKSSVEHLKRQNIKLLIKIPVRKCFREN